ncbi:MAG: hypothetical protein LW650_15545 [Planctomycetaceae bacterium]|nr:hypothetical protein [Planctomycetaceae bacterium]
MMPADAEAVVAHALTLWPRTRWAADQTAEILRSLKALPIGADQARAALTAMSLRHEWQSISAAEMLDCLRAINRVDLPASEQLAHHRERIKAWFAEADPRQICRVLLAVHDEAKPPARYAQNWALYLHRPPVVLAIIAGLDGRSPAPSRRFAEDAWAVFEQELAEARTIQAGVAAYRTALERTLHLCRNSMESRR